MMLLSHAKGMRLTSTSQSAISRQKKNDRRKILNIYVFGASNPKIERIQ